MLNTRRKRLVGALEYMKGSVDDAFNAYHDGTQNAVQSKLRLWADLSDVLQRVDRAAFAGVGWLRVNLPHDDKTASMELLTRLPEVLTLRYVGPRAEQGVDASAVAYLTLRVRSANALANVVQDLSARGYSVRDWSFGCQQGGKS